MQRLQTTNAKADVLKHLGDSLHAQWRGYRRGLKRCQRSFSTKSVHDSRIATRRLLSTIELPGAFTSPRRRKKISEALKQYLDSFDELRDTHVQLVHVRKLTDGFPAARAFRKWLQKREGRFIRQTRKAIKRTKTKRLGVRIMELEKEIRCCHKEMPRAKAFGAVWHPVNRAFARVTQLRRRVKAGGTESIHRTRVAFKRYRYMLEVLSPLLPAVTREFQRALRDYQAMMGDVQDTKMLLETFDEFRRRKAIDRPAAKRLRNELTRRRRRLIQNYLNAADKLKQFQPAPALAQAKTP